MSSKLYRGSDILNKSKQSKTVKLTRTQTAKQAKSAIARKYKELVPSAQYWHRGGGVWVKYSPSRDKKRTSKGAKKSIPKNYDSIKHKIDVRGVDTKRKGSKVHIKQISIAAKKFQKQRKATRRRTESQLWGDRNSALAAIKNVLSYHGAADIKVSFSKNKYDISYVDGPLTTSPKIISLKSDIITMGVAAILSERKRIAKITGNKYSKTVKKPSFTISRKLSIPVKIFVETSGDNQLLTSDISKARRSEILKSPKSKTGYGKINKKDYTYRYGMYSRGLWAGFNLSVPFITDDSKKADMHPIKRRLPKAVLLTKSRIPQNELALYEIENVSDVKDMVRTINYAKNVKEKESIRKALVRMVHNGELKTISDINKYLSDWKAKQQKKVAAKSKQSTLGV